MSSWDLSLPLPIDLRAIGIVALLVGGVLVCVKIVTDRDRRGR